MGRALGPVVWVADGSGWVGWVGQGSKKKLWRERVCSEAPRPPPNCAGFPPMHPEPHALSSRVAWGNVPHGQVCGMAGLLRRPLLDPLHVPYHHHIRVVSSPAPPSPPPHPTGHSDSRDQANGAVCERAGVRGQQPQGGQCPLRAGQNGRGGWGWGRGRRRRRRRRGGQVPAQPGEWERGLVQVDEVCLGKTRDGGSESQRIQVDEWGGAGMGGRHRSAAAGPPPLNSFSHTHTRMHLKFHP